MDPTQTAVGRDAPGRLCPYADLCSHRLGGCVDSFLSAPRPHTGRPLLRQFWICAAHSCSFVWCFNSALVILTPPQDNSFGIFRNYCLVPVYARGGLTLTFQFGFWVKSGSEAVISGGTGELQPCTTVHTIYPHTTNGVKASVSWVYLSITAVASASVTE